MTAAAARSPACTLKIDVHRYGTVDSLDRFNNRSTDGRTDGRTDRQMAENGAWWTCFIQAVTVERRASQLGRGRPDGSNDGRRRSTRVPRTCSRVCYHSECRIFLPLDVSPRTYCPEHFPRPDNCPPHLGHPFSCYSEHLKTDTNPHS